MLILQRLRKVLLKHFIDLKWQSIVFVVLGYVCVSWLLLWCAGETALTNNANFIYWIMVTASTVGYGDFSPTTVAGKYIVSLFVIPMGLGLFGLGIGRIAAFVSLQWRKGVQGLKNLNYTNHILVIGWNETRTLHLLRLLLREAEYQTETQNIALCVRADIENPLPDQIGFVKVSSFNSDEDMQRSALDRAGCIIIDNPDDEVTMTTALYCSSRNPNAHMIAYFKEERLGELLKSHCPNVECMPSVAVEMIAKSAMDPGSSSLHHQLLAVDKGMTQYSVAYNGSETLTVSALFNAFKERYEAILIGISCDGPENIELNPPLTATVKPGCKLYYIADERVRDIQWSSFHV